MATPGNPGRISPSATGGTPYSCAGPLGPADVWASDALSGSHDGHCMSDVAHHGCHGMDSALWVSSACTHSSSSTSSSHCPRLVVAFSALSSSYCIPSHKTLLPWPPVNNFAWRDCSCAAGLRQATAPLP